jgi:hypothetical protein
LQKVYEIIIDNNVIGKKQLRFLDYPKGEIANTISLAMHPTK